MPIEKVNDKRYGEITKYKCDFCRTEYTNQRELQENVKLELMYPDSILLVILYFGICLKFFRMQQLKTALLHN
jgi:hypothetical protein